MASSSDAGAAHDTRVDNLDRLVERALEAGVVSRGELAATLFSIAENLASQLHPDDTCLIGASLEGEASLFAEITVKQFKYCGDCEEEWYCCAEHQVLHWKEHKPVCRARTAAAA